MNALTQLLATLASFFKATENVASTFEILTDVGKQKAMQFRDEATIRRINERKELEASTGINLRKAQAEEAAAEVAA